MKQLSISLPEKAERWVENRVRSGEYSSAEDYILDLIRHDEGDVEALRAALIVGERSGLSKKKIRDIVLDCER